MIAYCALLSDSQLSLPVLLSNLGRQFAGGELILSSMSRICCRQLPLQLFNIDSELSLSPAEPPGGGDSGNVVLGHAAPLKLLLIVRKLANR